MKGIILLPPVHKSLSPLTKGSSAAMLNFFDQPLIGFVIQQMKKQGMEEICVAGEDADPILLEYLEKEHAVSFYTIPPQGVRLEELASPHNSCILFGQLTLTDYPLETLRSHQESHAVTGIFSEQDKTCHNGFFFCPKSSYHVMLSKEKNLFSSFSEQNIPLNITQKSGYFRTISNLPEYLEALTEQLNHQNLPKKYHQSNGVIHSEHTFIELGAKIKPPVYLGDHITIQKNAEILPYSVICSHSVIGENAKVSHSVLSPYCQVKENATVSGAVLGEGVTVSEGTTITDGSVYSKNITVSSQKTSPTIDKSYSETALSFTPYGIPIPPENATAFLQTLGHACGTLFTRGIVGLFQDDSVAAEFLSHSLRSGLQGAGISLYEFPPCTLSMCRSACSFYQLKVGFYLYEKDRICHLIVLNSDGTQISENTEKEIKNQLEKPSPFRKNPLLKITPTNPYQLYYFSEINRKLGNESADCKLYAEVSSPMLYEYLQKVANCHKVTLITEQENGVIGFQSNPSGTEFTVFDENKNPLSPRQKEAIIAALMIAERESNFLTTAATPHVLRNYLTKNKVTPIEANEHPHLLESAMQAIPFQYYLANDPVYFIIKILLHLKQHQLTLSQWISSLPKSFLIEKTITAKEQLTEAVEHLLGIAQAKESDTSRYCFSSKKGITTITQNGDSLKIVSESNQEEYAKELTDFYVRQCSKKRTE